MGTNSDARQARPTRRRSAQAFTLALTVCAALAACAGDEARRYERMRSAYRQAASAGAEASASGEAEGSALPFDPAAPLERAALVREVLRRSPDLEAARQAWRASLARYPQVTAFEDPMLEYEFAPVSLGGGVPFGQNIELRQALPWPGRRALAGQMALAEAEAARHDFEAVRRVA